MYYYVYSPVADADGDAIALAFAMYRSFLNGVPSTRKEVTATIDGVDYIGVKIGAEGENCFFCYGGALFSFSNFGAGHVLKESGTATSPTYGASVAVPDTSVSVTVDGEDGATTFHRFRFWPHGTAPDFVYTYVYVRFSDYTVLVQEAPDDNRYFDQPPETLYFAQNAPFVVFDGKTPYISDPSGSAIMHRVIYPSLHYYDAERSVGNGYSPGKWIEQPSGHLDLTNPQSGFGDVTFDDDRAHAIYKGGDYVLLHAGTYYDVDPELGEALYHIVPREAQGYRPVRFGCLPYNRERLRNINGNFFLVHVANVRGSIRHPGIVMIDTNNGARLPGEMT